MSKFLKISQQWRHYFLNENTFPIKNINLSFRDFRVDTESHSKLLHGSQSRVYVMQGSYLEIRVSGSTCGVLIILCCIVESRLHCLFYFWSSVVREVESHQRFEIRTFTGSIFYHVVVVFSCQDFVTGGLRLGMAMHRLRIYWKSPPCLLRKLQYWRPCTLTPSYIMHPMYEDIMEITKDNVHLEREHAHFYLLLQSNHVAAKSPGHV